MAAMGVNRLVRKTREDARSLREETVDDSGFMPKKGKP